MADNDSAGGFGWFLAGLGIGALVGVLYAPKSGKETRDDLKAGAMEAKDRANELYEQGKTQAAASMPSRASRLRASMWTRASRRRRSMSIRARSITTKDARSGRSMWTRART